jgi:hypothetical protein
MNYANEIWLVAGFGEPNRDRLRLRPVLVRVLSEVDADGVVSKQHRFQLSDKRFLADEQRLSLLLRAKDVDLSPTPVGVGVSLASPASPKPSRHVAILAVVRKIDLDYRIST